MRVTIGEAVLDFEDMSMKKAGYFVGKWIPVSERLPETTESFSDCYGFDKDIRPINSYTCYESNPVLVTDGDNIYTAIYNKWVYEAKELPEEAWCDNCEGAYRYENIIAWMPLPEPYEEEQEDD